MSRNRSITGKIHGRANHAGAPGCARRCAITLSNARRAKSNRSKPIISTYSLALVACRSTLITSASIAANFSSASSDNNSLRTESANAPALRICFANSTTSGCTSGSPAPPRVTTTSRASATRASMRSILFCVMVGRCNVPKRWGLARPQPRRPVFNSMVRNCGTNVGGALACRASASNCACAEISAPCNSGSSARRTR